MLRIALPDFEKSPAKTIGRGHSVSSWRTSRQCSPYFFSAMLALLLFFSALPLQAVQDNDTPNKTPNFTDQQLEYFENKVRPILAEHCFECHGPKASPLEGSFSVESRNAILVGGDTGPAIVPGQAHESLLIESINYDGVYEMPPDTKLDQDKIDTLTKWVNEGAPWPKSEDVEVVKKKFNLDERKSAHWAWKPVRKHTLPKSSFNEWNDGLIDQAIAVKLEQAGLKPAKATDRRTLIRRVYYDLVGLPPTPKQVETFVNDESPKAFSKVVDRLLASEHFGEHWTRHWMDLVRYAETYGHEFDYPIPYGHQYRDYLIRALNGDVSYKQIIEEHIAGDLIPKPRRHKTLDFNESKLATGFWFFGEAKHAAVDSRGEQASTIDNQIDVMSKTFLGLTVACARCHDHKFDAISTADYYAFSGFLKSSRRERMMLDPGQKIAAALAKTKKAIIPADALSKKLIAELQEVDRTQLLRYLNAATENASVVLNQLMPEKLQGETLQQVGSATGTTEIQTIKGQTGFKWDGDQQIWWRDGKKGDSWTVEFPVDQIRDNKSSKYQVVIRFTKANDYGAARILLNGNEINKRIDFYSPTLRADTVNLGELELKPGKQKLTFEILAANQKAIARNMIGIDFIQLKPIGATDLSDAQAKAAKLEGLDTETLQNIVDLICEDDSKQISHPFFQLRQLAQAKQQNDKWTAADQTRFEKLYQRADEQQATFLEKSFLYEDFNDTLPKHWSTTGFAFSDIGSTVRSNLADDMLLSPGVISSGRHGAPFYGVLRSPVFKVENERIHYRVRGRNVTVRLIVNGFFMDEYNALLFKDCKKTLPEANEFTWVTQAGDIKNHIGNDAYLEIIDHGNGFVEIDEIRFSKNANPPANAPFLTRALIGGAATVGPTVDRFLNLLQDPDHLTASQQQASTQLASWINKNRLYTALFSGGGEDISVLPDRSVFNASFATNPNSATSRIMATAGRLGTTINRLRESNLGVPAPMMALGMTDGPGLNEHVFVRGNHKNLGPIVERRFLSALSKSPIAPEDSSGRLKLAKKITAPNNPLTARVAVNRVWHHAFGRGIVESVDNFGVLGKKPSHPELLDNLAIEFKQNGWSIKDLLRKIVLSKTYQMSSDLNSAAMEVDPDNLLLHRANIKRLSGEQIRDSMLLISGRLDPQMYGPSVPVYLTPFMTGRGRPGSSGPLDGNGRRSVYMEVRRNFLSPMMLAFDTPIPFNAIGRRNRSNVPSQALILMNSPFVETQAEQWAKQLVSSTTTVDDRIESTYLAAFSREPSEQERQAAKDFLKLQAKELAIPDDKILSDVSLWKDFCHVLFNVKEFIYIQ